MKKEGKVSKGAKEASPKAAASPKPAPAEKKESQPIPVPRLKEHYRQSVIPEMMKRFQFKNVMQVPKVTKIVVNMGVKLGVTDKAAVEAAAQDMGLITGQRPVVTKAKKSISAFKLREHQPIGCKVTLRGNRMYEFMDRLVSIAVPRVRDFRGLPTKSFDGNGNYSFGLTEQIVFPEVELDRVKNILGMDITFVTTAKRNEVAKEFLSLMGVPFAKAV